MNSHNLLWLSFVLLSSNVYPQQVKEDSLYREVNVFTLAGVIINNVSTDWSSVSPYFSIGTKLRFSKKSSIIISTDYFFLKRSHLAEDTIVYASIPRYNFSGGDAHNFIVKFGLNHRLFKPKNRINLYVNYSIDFYFVKISSFYGTSYLGKSLLENSRLAINSGLTIGLITQYQLSPHIILSLNTNGLLFISNSKISINPIPQFGVYYIINS